jgi:hypothetical protein
MNALTIHFGDAMITYDELCKAYAARLKESQDSMRAVRRLYRTLANAIAEDLGLLGKTFDTFGNDKGEAVRYVKMGVVEGIDDLKPINEHELPVSFTSKDGAMVCYTENAAVAVTLELSPTSYPKQSIYIRMDVELCGDVLRVVFPDSNHMAFDVPVHDEHVDFSPVVTAYKQLVLNSL